MSRYGAQEKTMNLLPVMVRELRAQSRQPMTYWLRVIGISAIIVVMSFVYLRFAPYRIGMQSNPLTTLSVKKLKHAVAIRAQIETLQNQLDRIAGAQAAPAKNGASGKKKRRLSVAARAKISAAARARWAKAKGKMKASGLPAARTKTRTSGAPLKTRIIHSLRSAGKSGVAVKELAAKLGKSYGNISVWFHTTAKGVNEIKKVAPGRFAWMP